SFILLQETHVSNSLIPFSLLSSFPSFSWFSLPSAIPGRQGIAIGVRTSALLPFSPVNFHPSPDLSSLAISAHLPLHGRISIASSYSHPSSSHLFLSPLTSFLRSLPQPLFWGGTLMSPLPPLSSKAFRPSSLLSPPPFSFPPLHPTGRSPRSTSLPPLPLGTPPHPLSSSLPPLGTTTPSWPSSPPQNPSLLATLSNTSPISLQDPRGLARFSSVSSPPPSHLMSLPP